MGSDRDKSPLEKKLSVLAVLFALLSIPAIVLQSTSSENLRLIGQLVNIMIWLFFVAEVVILLRIEHDNLAWLRAHKLEVTVVVLASPFLTVLSEGESAFALAPLAVVARSLRFLRFAKLAKLLKLGKVNKIVRKSSTPVWLVAVVMVVCGLLALALLGMVLDHEAHSLVEGLTYWTESIQSGLKASWTTLGVTTVVLLLAVYLIRQKTIEPLEMDSQVDL